MDSVTGILAGRRVAFIFAHYDDGPFSAAYAMTRSAPGSIDLVSCSGVPHGLRANHAAKSIMDLARHSQAVKVVVHAFGRPVFAEWDRACNLRISPANVMELRFAEQAAADRMLGVETLGLGDFDSQYRRPRRKIVSAAVGVAIDEVRARDIEMIVTHSLSAIHPDHLRARSIALAVAEATGLPACTVCDRPYVRCSPDTCVTHERFPAVSTNYVELDDQVWRLKEQAMGCYGTQIPTLTDTFGEGWLGRGVAGIECYQKSS